jgi:2-deoxy-D-gluconate 3-dehydrogenase
VSDLSVFDLSGKNVIVTGGAVGIGFGIVECMVDAGANVLVVDIDGEAARAAAHAVSGRGTKTAWMELDVAADGAGEHMVTRCVDELGSIDILVNNAGIYPSIPMLEMTPEQFDRVYRLNLRALAFASKAAAARMIEQGRGGRIINVGSVDCFHPSMVGLAAYDSSKGGVLMFTRNFAIEMAPHGIRVNLIAPGGIDTPGATKPLEGSGMSEEQMHEMRQRFIDTKIPLKRFGVPEDIGKVAVFLAAPASDYMTGSAVVVDGGMLLS